MALAGKHAAVFGFASHRSLAWGVAEAWHRAGATLSISLQSDRFRPSLEKLTRDWPNPPHVLLCDVTSDADVDAAFQNISDAHGGRLHCLLHSIAYATAHGIRSPLLECGREDFRVAHDASAYSLIALARGAATLMTREALRAGGSSTVDDGSDGASIITLSYLGAQRVVTQYGIMGAAKASLEAVARQLAVEMGPRGVRVNVLSPGPIDTLAARGIPGFSEMRAAAAAAAPLGRGVTQLDVGRAATFLASTDSSGVTGQTVYVDCGTSALA